MAKKAEFNAATVKKYVFWVCVPIGLLVPLVLTSLAVGKIGKQFTDRKTALETQKNEIQQISSDSAHPNEATIAEIDNFAKDLRGRVVRAWGTMEKDQKERNTWPAAALSPEFMKEIVKKKFHDAITTPSRETYLNFIEKYLPELEYNVGRRRVQYFDQGEWRELDPTENVNSMASGGSTGMSGGMDSGMSGSMGSSGMGTGMSGSMGSGGMMGGSGGGVGFSEMNATGTLETVLPKGPNGEEIYRYVGTVDWPNPETRAVTVGWQRLPKSNEVWYAQEDLWVYGALLSVVKECNAEATGPHNAVIKRIENLLIGQQASAALAMQSANRIGAGAAGMMGDSMMSGGMMSGSSSMDASASSTSPDGMSGGPMSGMMQIPRTEEDVITIKKNQRYVDDKGVPLSATDESPFEQFKRMPICLRFIVDQRKIPEVLVSCANCSMPIDVLWVRFNPAAKQPFELSAYDASIAAAGMEGMDGMSGGMSGSMGSSGMSAGSSMDSTMMSGGTGMGGSADGSSMGGGTGEQVILDEVGGAYGSYAIPIEIYGCINIFNPVNESGSLQKNETPEGTATGGESTGATPAGGSEPSAAAETAPVAAPAPTP